MLTVLVDVLDEEIFDIQYMGRLRIIYRLPEAALAALDAELH